LKLSEDADKIQVQGCVCNPSSDIKDFQVSEELSSKAFLVLESFRNISVTLCRPIYRVTQFSYPQSDTKQSDHIRSSTSLTLSNQTNILHKSSSHPLGGHIHHQTQELL
jgi:hypothetical protein